MNYSIPKEEENWPRFNSYVEYVDYFSWLLDQGVEGIAFAARYYLKYSAFLFKGYEINNDIKNHKNYIEFYKELISVVNFRLSIEIEYYDSIIHSYQY